MSESERGAGGAFIRPLEGARVSPLMSEAKYKGALRQTLVCRAKIAELFLNYCRCTSNIYREIRNVN